MSTPMPDYGITFEAAQSLALATLDAQAYAQKFLEEQVADPNYIYDISAAQLWAIKEDNNFHLLSAHPDVYELLQHPYNLSKYVGIIIHTTGWAAPLSEDGEVEGAPSKHALRRRVALAACVTSISVASALSFSDEEDIIIDPGTATGSLADALLSFWEQNTIPWEQNTIPF
jgi:hypothetical protein